MKKYIFDEVDANGANIRHYECGTLQELSKEANITTSTLFRIKQNRTQNKKKGKYSKCTISVCHEQISMPKV